MTAAVKVDPVAAATYFVTKLGCTAFPIWGARDGRCMCPDPHDDTVKWDVGSIGKHPATINGFHDATADVERIRTFLGNPGTPNYGLNPPPGVLAIDVDGEADIARWRELQVEHGELPVTLTTLTAHGRHYFFRWPESVGPMPSGQLFGYVVRYHDTGYVIGPGSVHVSGFVYDTLRQASGMPYDIAELPESWARAMLASKSNGVHITIGKPLPDVGHRHDWLRDTARFYAGVIRDPDALKAAIMAENAKLPQPKSEAAVIRAIGEVLERFPADPVELTDEGEPRRVVTDDLDMLGLPAYSDFPAEPDPEAYDGTLGEMTRQLAEGTDAPLVGLLGSLIAFCGALVPGSSYFHRSQTSSPFIALVGESSFGRKGTAMNRAYDALAQALEVSTVNRVILDGLNSGEGLISALSYKREHYPQEPTVGLVFEEEYAALIASRGRDGSTLDPRMRQAFDGGPLSNRKANETKVLLPPYWLPALIAITPTELRHRLEAGALQSGSANRWLYLPVVRRPVEATNTAPEFSYNVRSEIMAAAREAAKKQPTPDVEPDVRRSLAEYSEFLAQNATGLAADLTKRYPVIAFRVALVHALVDRTTSVTAEHCRRALALTEYARRGITWVFGHTIGDPNALYLYRQLLEQGRLTQNAITRHIIRDPIKRQAAIDELIRIGRARRVSVQTTGRARHELEAVADEGGAFVTFVHLNQYLPTQNAETVDERDEMDESAQETWTKGGRKVDERGRKWPH